MKTATITLETTPGIAVPTDKTYGAWAGFSVTLTSAAGNSTPATPSTQVVWTFTGLVEGASYQLAIASVDANGQVINSLPVQTITVPAAQTYTRVDGAAIDWS